MNLRKTAYKPNTVLRVILNYFPGLPLPKTLRSVVTSLLLFEGFEANRTKLILQGDVMNMSGTFLHYGRILLSATKEGL